MIKKHTFAVIFLLLSIFTANAIDWTQVNSYVAWFNAYHSPGLLSLSVDGTPALNGNGPASLFGKTKFPPGSYTASITDSKAKTVILTDSIHVRDSGNHFMITYGTNGNPEMVFFHQSDFIENQDTKIIFFVNALGAGNATVSYEDSKGNRKFLEVAPTLKLKLPRQEEIKNIQLSLKSKDGQTRSQTINLPPFDQFQGLIAIAYLDPDDFALINYALVDATNLSFIDNASSRAGE